MDTQFKATVKRRGVGSVRNKRKYLHLLMNEQLFNLGDNAIKLMFYIQLRISCAGYNEATKYYIAIDTDFKEDYLKFLTNKGIKSNIRSIEYAVKELVDNNVLLKIRRGKYLYNFVDFAHVGNNEQWEIDKVEYDIVTILDKTKNNK